jgi:hypothetical protein
MKRLIHSLKNFGKYPSQLTSLSKFFTFDKKGKYEFCRHGEKCELLEPGVLEKGQKPQMKCSSCMKEYLENSGLDEDTSRFLYDRFRPDNPKDNSWIIINENFDEEDNNKGE